MPPRRTSEPGPTPESGDGAGSRARGPRIRCPHCAWEPRAEDRWQCECFHVWNTFDTRGRCPACEMVWRVTQCLACDRVSDHDAWYEER